MATASYWQLINSYVFVKLSLHFPLQAELQQQLVHRVGLALAGDRVGRVRPHRHCRSSLEGSLEAVTRENVSHEDSKQKSLHQSRELRKLVGKD